MTKPAPPLTEEQYRELLNHNPKSARARLGHFRAACAREGIELPSWAAPPSSPSGASASAAAGPPATPAEIKLTQAALAGQAFSIELSRWRAAGDRVLALRVDGSVTLIDLRVFERYEATFATVAEAIAALSSGVIHWRAVKRRKVA